MLAVPESNFSTDTIAPMKRYESFRESMGVIFEVTRPQATGSEFQANIKSYLLDEFLLVDCKTNGQTFSRSASMISADQSDHFLFQTFYYGGSRRVKSQKESFGTPGKILVIDSSQEWAAINPDFYNLTLVVPRRLIAHKLLHENDHHGRVLGADNPFANVLLSTLTTIKKSISTSGVADLIKLSWLCVDLAASALNRSSHVHTASDSERLLAVNSLKLRVKQYVERNLHDFSLCAESVAQHFGLSRSHLYRVFDFDGGIANYIRQRRLELASRRLVTSSEPNMTICQIAASLGYQNESSFTRAYKKRYGYSPRDFRNHTLQKLPLRRQWQNQNCWQNWFINL